MSQIISKNAQNTSKDAKEPQEDPKKNTLQEGSWNQRIPDHSKECQKNPNESKLVSRNVSQAWMSKIPNRIQRRPSKREPGTQRSLRIPKESQEWSRESSQKGAPSHIEWPKHRIESKRWPMKWMTLEPNDHPTAPNDTKRRWPSVLQIYAPHHRLNPPSAPRPPRIGCKPLWVLFPQLINCFYTEIIFD